MREDGAAVGITRHDVLVLTYIMGNFTISVLYNVQGMKAGGDVLLTAVIITWRSLARSDSQKPLHQTFNQALLYSKSRARHSGQSYQMLSPYSR